jgi:hypothetical protein
MFLYTHAHASEKNDSIMVFFLFTTGAVLDACFLLLVPRERSLLSLAHWQLAGSLLTWIQSLLSHTDMKASVIPPRSVIEGKNPCHGGAIGKALFRIAKEQVSQQNLDRRASYEWSRNLDQTLLWELQSLERRSRSRQSPRLLSPTPLHISLTRRFSLSLVSVLMGHDSNHFRTFIRCGYSRFV